MIEWDRKFFGDIWIDRERCGGYAGERKKQAFVYLERIENGDTEQYARRYGGNFEIWIPEMWDHPRGRWFGAAGV